MHRPPPQFPSPSSSPDLRGYFARSHLHSQLRFRFPLSLRLSHSSISLVEIASSFRSLRAMAALTMASSVTAAVFPAPAVSFSESSFSAVSSVRMAPVKANRRLAVVAMATPNKDVKEKISIEDAIAEAQKTCEDDPTSAPCAVAWDEVEEKSAEIAHQRDRKKSTNDPLEKYCADNPETDECRTYED